MCVPHWGREVHAMPLSKSELQELIRLVGLTNVEEMNCEQCLALVAEFAERELAGKSIPEGLQEIEQHLSICAECREEYQALERTLMGMDA